MKIHIKSFLLVLLILGACDTTEFLETEPPNSHTPATFYSSEKQIDEAVVAIYNRNRSIMEGQWRFGEFRSDNTYYQRNEADRGGFGTEEIDEFTMNSDNGNILNYWNEWYDGILLANVVMQNIDNVDFNQNPDNKSIRKAEAQFFRSWFYFNLVRSFSDVPLVTSIASSPEDALNEEFTERVPASEIYDFVLSEAQAAIDNLPESWPASQVGRATKGAALMLKAKVHMTLQQFDQAIPLLRQMETLGYTILDDYQQVFDPENKNHKESVFELQYSFVQGQASNFLTPFVPFTSGNRIVLFGNAGSRAGLNQPTDDLIELYPEGDVREDVNIAYDLGVPYINKYNYPPLAPGQQDINYPMFRYADARLMLAESLAETGNWQDAIDIINDEIRPRTGVAEPVAAANAEEALEKIAIERRLELAFENHRWFDLVRTGKAVETMREHGDNLVAKRPFLTDGLEYTNIRTILAIPFQQAQQFGYEQNEGWE